MMETDSADISPDTPCFGASDDGGPMSPPARRDSDGEHILNEAARYDVLAELLRTGATLNRFSRIGRGMALAEISNRDTWSRYERPEHHTLSLYVEDGVGIRRVLGRRRIAGGHPGIFCLLPAEHDSEWIVDSSVRLMQLYIRNDEVARIAEEALDIDHRRIVIPDKTFFDDPELGMRMRNIFCGLDWSDPTQLVALGTEARDIIALMLRKHAGIDQGLTVSGGLSPKARRLVEDYVESNLDRPVTIDELAQVAGLSAFHFARMFRHETGISPHRFVTVRRIAHARKLLGETALPLSDVASACGFSSQAHFTTAFNRETGLTPRAYRMAVAS